jgi:hypothetical protein
MTTKNTHPIELALIGGLAVLWTVLELSKALVALCLLLARYRPSQVSLAVPLSAPVESKPAPTAVPVESKPKAQAITVAPVESIEVPAAAPVASKPKRAPRTRKAKPTPTPVAA